MSLEGENKKLKEQLECSEELRFLDDQTIRNINKDNLILKSLLKSLYESASKVDLEYCTVLNNYSLVPFDKKEKPYHISEDYDDIWMEDFIAVEEYLGIE